ncbi:hypothetical protein GGR50DRAFT_690756 [Xylaria sp. CBS 124048]|nr:hypothetical protein GGR50DRAFT_690756 [Xylaria sp. CBS 124048]
MAINEDVPGLEAFVQCSDREMSEIDDPEDDADVDNTGCPTTSRYIEVVDEAAFEVVVNVHENYLWGYRDHVLVANVHVDGQYVHGVVFRQRSQLRSTSIVGPESYCAEAGGWVRRKLKFAAVKTIDDAHKDRVEHDLKLAKGLGTIEVTFKREIQVGTGFSSGVVVKRAKHLELAEKSLKGKAVSHGTSFGSREKIRIPSFIHTTPIAEDYGPILRIFFKYRSRDALKRELVIPRSPSRSPGLEDLTPAERDRLARERLDQLRSNKVKSEGKAPTIKREYGETVDLTQEPRAFPPAKKARIDGRVVDIIDLTDD